VSAGPAAAGAGPGAATDPGPAEAAVVEALGRAATSRVLGRAFAYPTPDLLAGLARAAADAAAGPALAPEVREGLARLAGAARDAEPGTLAGEHVFLFDRQVRCPPYESAYGDVPTLAGKGAALADVAGFHAAFGVQVTATRPDLEDHVAAELEFLSVLAVREAWALAEGLAEGLEVTRRARTAFLTDHLGRWAGAFARRLRETTPVPFYVAAADLLEAWVAREVAAAGATPVPVTGPHDPGPLAEDAFTCPVAGAAEEQETEAGAPGPGADGRPGGGPPATPFPSS
jgi:TorA maturation chaperone TorD